MAKKYKRLVEYQNKIWRVVSRSDSGTVTIRRDNEKAVVLEEEIMYLLPF
jgi:hypothetical protein